MSANSQNMNYYSGFAKVSFDGFINENLFELNPRENNLIENLEIYHGVAKNPLNYQKETFLGFLVKSKYDGVGARKPIDISIALDVSGSMSHIDSDKIGKSRLTLAKEGLKKFVSILDEKNDRISLLTFNHSVQKLFTLIHKKEIESKFLSDIDAIEADGGTDLLGSIKSAMENFSIENNDSNKVRRILCITDAYYDDDSNNLYNLMKKCVEEKNISITFMTIGSDSNLSLADKLCEFKGCNYFSIAKTEELENFLVTNFKNIFFPVVHKAKLHVVCKNNNINIAKCIGYSGPEININANNESIFNIGTCFPSEIITLKEDDKDKNYVEGGIFLLKLQSLSNEKMNFEFNFEYETIDGKKSSQNYEYEITQEQLNLDYFSNKNIQKAISIFYFTEVLNTFVEKFNQLDNYDEDDGGDEMKKNKEIQFIENAQSVRDYLEKNFVYNKNDYESKKNLVRYKELITKRYQTYKEDFCRTYKIVNTFAL